jgi:hypothetical protein
MNHPALLISVSRLARGYVAENRDLGIIAGGSSAIEAAETARRMASEVLQGKRNVADGVATHIVCDDFFAYAPNVNTASEL